MYFIFGCILSALLGVITTHFGYGWINGGIVGVAINLFGTMLISMLAIVASKIDEPNR